VGGKSSESFAFNYSRSINTLNTSETKVEGSIGFATNVPPASDLRSGSNPDYAYDFSVMVFGQRHPPCDSSDGASSEVTCLWDNRTLEEEIKTQGTLWAGYTIDLSSGGNWWTAPDTGYVTLPDVALNHPERWVRDSSQSSGDNCLLVSSSGAELCYTQSATSLQPADIWDNEFHRMKGFFVVPAAKDAEGHFLEPQGPQTTVINSDGQVWLQARVHNYSFHATGTDRLHVRFYAQEWDASSHEPVNTPSVLVEEVVVDQCIPGHGAQGGAACSQGGDDNWILVTTSQPFDPTAHGIDPGNNGTYVLFWVLVWLEDSGGNPVVELGEHGLTGLPGNLTSLTAAASLSQTYGNNLGWFPLPIFVCPSGLDCSNVTASGATVAAAAANPEADAEETLEPEVGIARLKVPRQPLARHAPARLEALLRAGEVSPRGVHVALYEGDPEAGGAIFDVELVPYLRGSDSYLIRTRYRPESCGPREIHVVADPGGGLDPVTKAAEVNVSADLRVELAALRDLLETAFLPRHDRHSLINGLRQVASAFRRGTALDGLDALEGLRAHARGSMAVSAEIVDQIEARIDDFAACVAAAGGELATLPFDQRQHLRRPAPGRPRHIEPRR
jgi:hypothetical protein